MGESFHTRAEEWLHSRDTGLSSEAIFHYMTLGIRGGATPYDTSDLGRCVRLLDRFPEWQARMPEMACVSDNWAALMSIWDDLVAAYRIDLASDWASSDSCDMLDLFWVRADTGLCRRREYGFTASAPPLSTTATEG